MKKLIILIVFIFSTVILSGQQELHIHHINIEDGDATLVGIFDSALHKYTAKILIDGGNSNPNLYLLPYIQKICAGDSAPTNFNYVILTHYHKDHYNGLLALADGRLSADSIIDPGGYDFSQIIGTQTIQSPEDVPQSLVLANQYTSALTTATHHNPVFVKGRSLLFLSFGTTSATSIGHRLLLGKVGDNVVELECVAGWGNTLSSNGIVADPLPTKNNPNDFTLSFVLHCGQFRYFIGGDLGGQNQGDYIDQETPLVSYISKEYPQAHSMYDTGNRAGHICGIKADHHGSKTSNDLTFMVSLHPAITVTSAGKMPSWHLPSVQYLQYLAGVTPVSVATTVGNSVFNRGIYFTNLYNFNSTAASLDVANSLFQNKPGISYDYGNNTNSSKAGYMVKVRDASLSTKSTFTTYRVDIQNNILYTKLADFNCHSR